MHIDSSHPRAASLVIRERLVWGVKKGLTSTAGLIAHGRGEAFDYLLGETTHQFAKSAIKAAAATLLLATHPILSINGNTAVLCAKEFIKLAHLLHCKIEVNLFHYTKKRVETIENYLQQFAKELILLSKKSQQINIPHIASARKTVLQEGIGHADLVFAPLEDGDRTQALIFAGKKVITVDLNPLSRTAKKATITIVDNIVRSMPRLIQTVKTLHNQPAYKLLKISKNYNNRAILSRAITCIKANR